MDSETALRIAVKTAIGYCKENDILTEFLDEYGKDVTEMSLFEFSEEDYQELFREEGRLEGRTEGREEERIAAIRKLLDKGFEKDFILSLDYTKEEYDKAIGSLVEC